MDAYLKTTIDQHWLFLSGLLMGFADIVPGGSGGTMAFILGIYEDLLDAVHHSGVAALTLLRTRLRTGLLHIPWKFIIHLGLGIGAAIFSLAEGLHWLLETHPTFIWSFFFGLVLGSVIVVRKRIPAWQPAHLLLAAAGAVAGLLSLARVLRWTFNCHRDWTIAALVGLMLGSLRKLWPWKSFTTLEDGYLHELNLLPARLDGEVLGVVLLALAGFGVVLLIETLAKCRSTFSNR